MKRSLWLDLAFAVWGLAIAIALISVWHQPAPPDQLPGAAKALGFDARGPFRWIAGLMLLPLLVPLALRPVSRRLAVAEAWARNAAIAAPFVTLWLVTIRRSVGWTVVPCAIVILLALLLRDRDLRFTRRDVVLVAAFLPTLLGLYDAVPRLPIDAAIQVAALLLLIVRIAVAFIPSALPPALAFVAAPLALVLQTGFFARDQRYFGWHALAIVAITPFVIRFLQRSSPLTPHRSPLSAKLLVFAVYPIALFSYANALSPMTAEGKPRVNFFEDGHSLLPASEFLRGERPWRDILPAHGLIEDGLFDAAVLRGGKTTIGARTKARELAGMLVAPALYFLAFAVTGSAEGAFLAVLLTFLTGFFRGNLRLLPAIATLTFIAAAVRRRRMRFFVYAGVGVVVCGLTSLDFAAYTFLTLVVAVLRATPRRIALTRAAIGLAIAGIPLVIVLAAFGILGDFLHATFVETLAAGAAYTMTFFTPPKAMEAIAAFPDVLVALLDRTVFPYLFWCAVAIFVAVMLPSRVSRRREPLLLVAVWIVLAAISYAERHHLYFSILAGVVIVATILVLLRRRSPLAIPALFATLALANPTTHLGVIGSMREARGALDARWVEIPTLPRARGALFFEPDAKVVASAQTYVSLSLGADETFLDFTNSGILYFLLRRDCPIRWYEVPFHESEEAQREVIRILETNPKIRAVLVPPSPLGRFAIDGIANADRAPLVWEYLRTHFRPDFQEGEVVFWRRN